MIAFVSNEGEELSYRQLDLSSNRLANGLLEEPALQPTITHAETMCSTGEADPTTEPDLELTIIPTETLLPTLTIDPETTPTPETEVTPIPTTPSPEPTSSPEPTVEAPPTGTPPEPTPTPEPAP